jgi:hypothetical protein
LTFTIHRFHSARLPKPLVAGQAESELTGGIY